MYKTLWRFYYEGMKVEFIQYHFGKIAKFPGWYVSEGIIYEIEKMYTIKLIHTPKTIKKCLFNSYICREMAN